MRLLREVVLRGDEVTSTRIPPITSRVSVGFRFRVRVVKPYQTDDTTIRVWAEVYEI